MRITSKYLQVVLAVIAFCTATALAADKPKPVPVGGKIDWVYNYAEGRRISGETGKPMFVVFRCER